MSLQNKHRIVAFGAGNEAHRIVVIGQGKKADMGLGVFISKTLLERTGASVSFFNGHKYGARIVISWPRDVLEALDADQPDAKVNV